MELTDAVAVLQILHRQLQLQCEVHEKAKDASRVTQQARFVRIALLKEQMEALDLAVDTLLR